MCLTVLQVSGAEAFKHVNLRPEQVMLEAFARNMLWVLRVRLEQVMKLDLHPEQVMLEAFVWNSLCLSLEA